MRRYLVVLAVVAALLAGGCGIPDRTDVRVIGAGPSAGFDADDSDAPSEPPARAAASDGRELVANYLQAAAGDPENALNRVKAFLADDARSGFDVGPEIRVIRLTNELLYTPSDPEVTFNAQWVGTLRPNGVLEPLPDSKPAISEYTLRYTTLGGGLYITSAPDYLLLTDKALDAFYERKTIYFWNADNTSLIPDLRYMPRSVPSVQQPTTILNWLVNGPAAWLGDTVHGLPTGTAAPDNVNVPAATDGTLQVALTGQAVPSGDGKALERLRRQLQWSLRDLVPRTLELKIGNQDPVSYSGVDYQDSNVASRLSTPPERFVIYGGQVRRLGSPQSTDPVPVLKGADNKGFSAAAMSASSTHTYAAVVSGTGKNRKLRVAAARTGELSDLVDVSAIAGNLGRPIWAVTPDNDPGGAIGLITVDGKLYSFGTDGKSAPVDWQSGPGAISAISVAPDGHRIAIVAGGRLYRTVLDTSGDSLTMSTPEQLLPPTFRSIAAVAWSSETYLAVAGTQADGRSAVMDVSVDGALTYPRLNDIGKEVVLYLTAYPANPLSPAENSTSVSYETAGGAWDVVGDPVKILTSQLAGPAVTPQPDQVPSAPFFLD
jgi:hypothetical protein